MEYIVEDDVREFIRRLPDLDIEGSPTVYFSMLAIRSRYSKEFTGQKVKDIVVERKVIRPTSKYPNQWRENYLNKIYNLAILQKHAHYTVHDVIMPSKVMAIMSVITPRSVTKASGDLGKYILDRLLDGNLYSLSRLDVEFISRLHAYKDNRFKGMITLDIDDAKIYRDVYDDVSVYNKWMITRTSRGYHIILNLDSRELKTFYNGKEDCSWIKMNEKYNKGTSSLELQRRSQEPVPGTFYYSPLRENNYVEIIE